MLGSRFDYLFSWFLDEFDWDSIEIRLRFDWDSTRWVDSQSNLSRIWSRFDSHRPDVSRMWHVVKHSFGKFIRIWIRFDWGSIPIQLNRSNFNRISIKTERDSIGIRQCFGFLVPEHRTFPRLWFPSLSIAMPATGPRPGTFFLGGSLSVEAEDHWLFDCILQLLVCCDHLQSSG